MAKKLDGAGAVKMSTLEGAHLGIQRLHGIVEQMAMANKRNQSLSVMGMQFRRAATPLVGSLKGSFGAMADTVSAAILIATRSGNEASRVRGLRELIASLKTQLEIATNKVKEHHSIDDSVESE
jgi:hypothetical protein